MCSGVNLSELQASERVMSDDSERRELVFKRFTFIIVHPYMSLHNFDHVKVAEVRANFTGYSTIQ